MYILTVNDMDNGTIHTSLWDTERNAHKEACSIIMNEMRLMFPDNKIPKECEDINAMIITGNYDLAINEWNLENTICFSITCPAVQNNPSQINTCTAAELGTNTCAVPSSGCNQDDCDGCSHIDCEASEPEWSKISGSTCRKCNEYNEYTYPDREDKTYVCHRCKTYMNG